MKSNAQGIPRLRIAATADGIIGVGPIKRDYAARESRASSPALARRWKARAEKELASFLSGRGRSFSVPCDLRRLTPFTRAALLAAREIPYGEVRSYRWLAGRIGNPNAARAVGNALARNPIPILIPCHRVVRSDGTLGGYTLGLELKRKLLQMEKSAGCRYGYKPGGADSSPMR